MKLAPLVMLGVSVLAIAVPSIAEEKFHRMRAAEIRSTLVGKVVTDESHWADQFLADGAMGGHQLGQAQTGSWKLSKDGEICMVMKKKKKKPESNCFEIWLREDQVEYRRDGVTVSEAWLRPLP